MKTQVLLSFVFIFSHNRKTKLFLFFMFEGPNKQKNIKLTRLPDDAK